MTADYRDVLVPPSQSLKTLAKLQAIFSVWKFEPVLEHPTHMRTPYQPFPEISRAESIQDQAVQVGTNDTERQPRVNR
jgi:hypothetical protein